MNYFTHGWQYVDRPYFLAGTAVPDWLNVVDRKTRVRSRQALPHVEDADPCIAEVAAGIVQHCHDDAWFHQTRAFAELSLELGRRVRLGLPSDESFRPHFLGHILVEILLDAVLIQLHPDRLEAYYQALEQVDCSLVDRAVGQMAGGCLGPLATFIPLFSRERFLWDYLDDDKLLLRLNQVMHRVKLPTLPPDFGELLPQTRQLVSERSEELLGLATIRTSLARN